MAIKVIKCKCPWCNKELLLNDDRIKKNMTRIHGEYYEILKEYTALKHKEDKTEADKKQIAKLKRKLQENIEEMKRYKRLREDARRYPEYRKEFMNYERLAMKVLLDRETYLKILDLANEFYTGVVKWEVPLMYEEIANEDTDMSEELSNKDTDIQED